MASHKDFLVESKMLKEDWTRWNVDDLQLAAEIGRDLLERNKELEDEIKSQQILIDDQMQQIEFLSKQVTTMKEEDSNRCKFYEQLESSLYNLERTNAQLLQKSEQDKRRIVNMCENIDYLERKCEELSGTLDTIREGRKNRFRNERLSYSPPQYLNFNAGSYDSSEEENGSTYQPKRTQSLQDFRDFSPNQDSQSDFLHSHSNSPGLKNSENEFLQTLEGRVEELIRKKNIESEKILQLETQLRILNQENTNLQQQLAQITAKKDEEILSYHRKLLEREIHPEQVATQMSPHYNEPKDDGDKPTLLNGIIVPPSKSVKLDGREGEDPNSNLNVCRRCAMEMNVLNLVNSIEYENDDYSSLEFELARASESLSGDSSNHSSMDPNFSPIHYPGTNGEETIFEPGFLDYFFGTNKMLRKIHLKRSNENLVKPAEHSTAQVKEDSLDLNLLPEEDSSILKDIGIEKLEKIFRETTSASTSSSIPPNKSRTPFNPSVVTMLRKLKLPEKIPVDGPSQSGFDEHSLCDSAEVTVEIKQRSKAQEFPCYRPKLRKCIATTAPDHEMHEDSDKSSRESTKIIREPITQSPTVRIIPGFKPNTFPSPVLTKRKSTLTIPEYKQSLLRRSVFNLIYQNQQRLNSSIIPKIKVVGITGL